MDSNDQTAEHPTQETHHHAHKGNKFEPVKFLMDHKVYVIASLIYLVFALINFWPVTAHITSVVAGIGGDTYQSLWGIWFVSYSLLTLHQSIWHTSLVFWPIGANLAYQTFIPIASLLATPFTAVSLGFAYNVIFFLSFLLCGLTMFILARYLTKNSYAAFIAGLIFAFSALHIAQAYGHLDIANLEFIPIAIYLFIRMVKEDAGRYKKALLLAVSMVLCCFISNVQTGIILLLVLLVIAVLYLFKKETRQRMLSGGFIKAICLFVVATFILGIWAWIPIASAVLHTGSTVNSMNSVQYNALWSDDLLSFLVPTPYNGILGWLSGSYISIYHGDIAETASYMTYTAIVLALLGLWKHFKELRLWLALGLIFGVLALGPILLVGGSVTGIPLPGMLYRLIPFFNAVREPGRFDIIVTIALAIMAAYGVKTITEGGLSANSAKVGQMVPAALIVVAVITLAFMIESNGMPLSSFAAAAVTTKLSVSAAYAAIAAVPGNYSVLQLPIILNQASPLPNLYPGEAMYYQTVSHKPIVGGYLTRENTTQQLSLDQIPLALQATSLIDYGDMIYQSPIAENYTNQTLLTLYNYDTAFVAVNKAAYNETEFDTLANYLYGVFGAPVYNDNSTTVFSTGNAISKGLYKSYVSYPALSDWNVSVVLLNGSYVQEWSPIGYGAITVFAPDLNQTQIYDTVYHSGVYYTNSTISIEAAAPYGPEKLDIAVPTGNGNYTVLGTDNLTTQFSRYNYSVRMAAGPIGNTFFFLPQSRYPVKILNITFTKYG